MNFIVPVKQGTVIYGRFEVLERLGKGGFGEVFSALDWANGGNKVAIKVEEDLGFETSLEWEYHVYGCLWSRWVPIGIPRPITFFKFQDSDILVLPLLGRSLRDIWKNDGRFSLKNICMIGIQLLNRLEYIHWSGFLHLDVKPDNMLIGRGMDSKTVYLVDLGLANRKPFNEHDGNQIPDTEKDSFMGTVVFSSVYVDVECEHSRRDDIESMMYCLLILYRGWLPWCHGDWHDDRNLSEIVEEVKWRSRETLFLEMPSQLQEAWNIVRQMNFEDIPRYDRMRELFKELAETSCENDRTNFGVE